MPTSHFLQFQRGGSRSCEGAGSFLADAIKGGGIAVAVAVPRNATAILAEMSRAGCDPVAALRSGQFVLLESAQMLARFSHHGILDVEQFDASAAAMIQNICDRANGPVHVFGDMVGVLWMCDERNAAVELEHLWCRLQERLQFELFCAYPVDVFAEDFSMETLGGVFATHTHVYRSAESARLARALDRALDDVLGAQAAEVRSQISGTNPALPEHMPKADHIVLWLREHVPDMAQPILNRARELHGAASPRVFLRQEHSRA